MSEDIEIPIRRAQSRYATIRCSFCLSPTTDACFAWSSGVCICRECLKYATEEVNKAAKTQAIAEDLGKLVTKLTVTRETKAPEISHKEIIAEIQSILDGPPEPDDAA